MLVSDQSIRHIALDRRVGEHPTSIPITEPLTAIILYPDLLKSYHARCVASSVLFLIRAHDQRCEAGAPITPLSLR
jgi:hypothetical protein